MEIIFKLAGIGLITSIVNQRRNCINNHACWINYQFINGYKFVARTF